MAPRRTRSFEQKQALVALTARVADLELRMKLLEARVRVMGAELRSGVLARPVAERTARARRRPRCPGCLLELPPGRRGPSCVWCGFRFEAVGGILR